MVAGMAHEPVDRDGRDALGDDRRSQRHALGARCLFTPGDSRFFAAAPRYQQAE